MMAYWLFKSEPETYSWDDMVREGVGGWDGVRNHQAQNNMKAMKVGDRGFFYHSVGEKAIVGLVEVAETHQPDPTDPTGRWGDRKSTRLNSSHSCAYRMPYYA